jgi:hypothetical protein
MGSLKRKMRRQRAQKMAKQFTKELQKQLNAMGSMPDECLACKKPFDRKSKEHADTWKVVVRKQSQETHLYCPTCWDTAMKMIKEMEDQNDN